MLFASGASEIGINGKKELIKLANTLNKITPKIPQNIDWILQVEGHTDHIPIYNARFQSNWDLSSARAISVVEFLIKKVLNQVDFQPQVLENFSHLTTAGMR